MPIEDHKTVTAWQLIATIVTIMSLFLAILWAIVNELHRDSQVEHLGIDQRLDQMQRQIDRLTAKKPQPSSESH